MNELNYNQLAQSSQLQARHLRESPELAARGAQAPSVAVPGQPSASGGQAEA